MENRLMLRDASHTTGSMAVEYALILPALLVFTFGLMDAGRLLWTNITLTRATEVAARCGAVNNPTQCNYQNLCAGNIPACAATEAQNFGISDATATDFVVTTNPACGVQVKASYPFTFLVPWFPQFSASAPFGTTTMTLNATSCYK